MDFHADIQDDDESFCTNTTRQPADPAHKCDEQEWERSLLLNLRKSFVESYRYDYPPYSEFWQQFEFECTEPQCIQLSLKQLKNKIEAQMSSLYGMEVSEISLKLKKQQKIYENASNHIQKQRQQTIKIRQAIEHIIDLRNHQSEEDSKSNQSQDDHYEIKHKHFKFMGLITHKVKSNLLTKGLNINALSGTIFPTNNLNSRRPNNMLHPKQIERIKSYAAGVQSWQFFNTISDSQHFVSIDKTCNAIHLYSILQGGVTLRFKMHFTSLKDINVTQYRTIQLNLNEPPQIYMYLNDEDTLRSPKFISECEWEQIDVFFLRNSTMTMDSWVQKNMWIAIEGESAQDCIQIIKLAASFKLSITNPQSVLQKKPCLDISQLQKYTSQIQTTNQEPTSYSTIQSFKLTPLGLIRSCKLALKQFPLLPPEIMSNCILIQICNDFSHYLLSYYSNLLENIIISNVKYSIIAWKEEQYRIRVFCIDNSKENLLLTALPRQYQSLKPWAIAGILNDTFTSGIPYNLNSQKVTVIPSVLGKRYHDFTSRVSTIPRELMNKLVENIGLDAGTCAVKFISHEYKGLLVVGEKLTVRKSMVRGKYNQLDLPPLRQIAVTKWSAYRPGIIDKSCMNLLRTLGVTVQQANQLHFHSQALLKTLPIQNLLSLMPIESIFINSSQCYSFPQMSKLLQTQEPKELRQAIIHHFINNNQSSVLLRNSAKLIAIIDQHQTLKQDEIFCKISLESQKTFIPQSQVLIMRPPSFLASHIRKCSSLQEDSLPANHPFRQLQNVIVFPAAGNYPLSTQLALGQIGDEYVICWDEQIIKSTTLKKKYIIDGDQNKTEHKKYPSLSKLMLECFKDRFEFGGPSRIARWHQIRMNSNPKYLAEDLTCRQLAKLYGKSEHFYSTGLSPYLPPNLQPKYPSQPTSLQPQDTEPCQWHIQ